MILFFALILASIVAQLFLPWWGGTAAVFIISLLLGKKGISAFAAGFFAFGLVWLGLALYTDLANQGILTNRIATMMGASHPVLIFALTFAIGALLGGLSALAGFHTQGLFKKRKQGYYSR